MAKVYRPEAAPSNAGAAECGYPYHFGMTAPTDPELVRKLASLRMFVAVFAVVQAIAAGVVVFSVLKMNVALVRHPLAPDIFFGVAAAVLLLVALLLRRVVLLVRHAKREDPDAFARFTSESLVRTFLINLPALILVAGYALTAYQPLLYPAAVGLVAIGFTRPTMKQYDAWRTETGQAARG
jgi:hypothetical protein